MTSRLYGCISLSRPHHVGKSTTRRFFSADNKIHPAIILGGGPTGLLLSNLLSSYSIPHLLFEKRPQSDLLKHPQAHFINLRSMEILRHELPAVHQKIVDGMPPVSEWEAFHFGGSIIGGKRLGRVLHPVRETLQIGQRGDAILASDGTFSTSTASVDDTKPIDELLDRANIVSPCKPAHLAQNEFVSLLLDEAQRLNGGYHLHYNEEVVNITEQTGSSSTQEPIVTLQTSANHQYRTRYLLACDGVHSFARKHCNIPMRGDAALQHMMNIHFRTNAALSELLMKQTKDHAMLHFVYNPKLVGAFVCHDGTKGEYVLQVPYFPPYQVPEIDFTIDKVREMIWFGLLGRVLNDQCNFDVLSIRSWTMSSQVAERYMNQSQNVLLVGDAAHAFPPAGGFGMNTGLQDAHNLAWRLALTLDQENRIERIHSAGSSDELPAPLKAATAAAAAKMVLTKYERDRQPVASQNAALSVRNYQRTLRIAKACYLDAQHPQLLMGILGTPPMSLLPLKTRQNIFRQMVKVAMMPLESLLGDQNSLHASHVENNVQKILKSGGSLPLVFPRFELGFRYNAGKDISGNNPADDSAGYFPKIEVGHRLPHAEIEQLSALEASHQHTTFTNSGSACISLVDISSQLRNLHNIATPLFTLIVLGSEFIDSLEVQEATNNAIKKWNFPLAVANIFSDKSKWTEKCATDERDRILVKYFLDVHQTLYAMSRRDLTASKTGQDILDKDMNVLILVRPDGHIANASFFDTLENNNISISSFIDEGFRNSLG